MWVLRPFQPKDWAALFKLHNGTFDVPQRMEEAVVIEDEETGEVVGIQGCRVVRECYVWMNHDWKTPKLRWRVFEEMHEALRLELLRKKVDEIFVWIEPTKNGKPSGFAKRLMKKLGWTQAPWMGFALKIFKR